MKLINMSQCNKINLPLISWPEQNIGQAYQNHLLVLPKSDSQKSKTTTDSNNTINDPQIVQFFETQDLIGILQNNFQHLSFIEALKLYDFFKEQQVSIEFQQYCMCFGWQNPNLSFEKFKTLLSFDQDFLIWCKNKKLNPQDFIIFSMITNPSQLTFISTSELHKVKSQLFQKIVELDSSKQSGLQLLELMFEILLMNKVGDLDFTIKNEALFLTHLKSIRYPQTSNLDKENDNLVKNYVWPQGVQAKWSRRGDKAGIELKLFLTNSAEAKKNIQLLEKVQNEFFKS